MSEKNWKFDWNNIELIKEYVTECNSKRDVLKKMGYHYNKHDNSHARRKLSNIIKEHNIDTAHFGQAVPERWVVLPDIINECFSLSEVIRAVGLQDVGNNNLTAKRYIAQLGLDTSHFTSAEKRVPANKLSHDDVFKEHSSAAKATVRNRVLNDCLIDYSCAKCGITKWNGESITLQLEHKNGCNTDHRLENLEFLCPNCHSQTKTWGNKKRI